jgi:hypothetical protein
MPYQHDANESNDEYATPASGPRQQILNTLIPLQCQVPRARASQLTNMPHQHECRRRVKRTMRRTSTNANERNNEHAVSAQCQRLRQHTNTTLAPTRCTSTNKMTNTLTPPTPALSTTTNGPTPVPDTQPTRHHPHEPNIHTNANKSSDEHGTPSTSPMSTMNTLTPPRCRVPQQPSQQPAPDTQPAGHHPHVNTNESGNEHATPARMGQTTSTPHQHGVKCRTRHGSECAAPVPAQCQLV